MESESGRCRRTDGRKWRCSRNVVPNQKYCERHMHRGRQGSRKHVEHVVGPDTPMPVAVIALVPPGPDTKTNVGSSQIQNSGTENGGTCDPDKNSAFEDVNSHVKTNRRLKKDNLGFVLPRFGLSPTSVLHCGGGKVGLGLGGSQDVVEAAQRRCRRTDGKKWQCRHDAVPNQKYCEAHMHRGAKRAMSNPGCPTAASAWRGMERNRDSGINLNTIPESPECISRNSSTSTSSGATTITDENISSYHRKC